MYKNLEDIFPQKNEQILAERTLLYLNNQRERFGAKSIDVRNSFEAYLKHDINGLMQEGKIDPADIGTDLISCQYIQDNLPPVLEKLVYLGYLEKEGKYSYMSIKPLSSL